MPDRIRLIAPQDQAITSSLSLTAKWVRTYEELIKSDFDEDGIFTQVVTREVEIDQVPTFIGLQLEEDPGTTPKGYTNGSDIVPLMTAATTEGVTISDNGNLGSGYEGFRAFDNATNSRWAIGSPSGILTVALASPKKISGYTIRARNDTYLIDSPKNWTFEGSNDGVNWTVLDTRTGQISWAMNELKTFAVAYANVALYGYYRLNVIANQSGTNVSFSEMELLEGIGYDFDFYTTGNRVIGPFALSGTAYGDEIITWELGDMPTGTSIAISCALTSDLNPPGSYTQATNGAQCPVITQNDDMTGKYIWFKQTLNTSDITKTPSLMKMEMQLVLDAVANMTIEIDRTAQFTGLQHRTTTVSALPCGEPTTFYPQDVYDGFLCWRARAVNATLGIDTGWSQINTFNLTGGPFPLPRYLSLLENIAFGKPVAARTLDLKENRAFGKPRDKRALYNVFNRAFGKLRATRALYNPLNVTDDPPFPWIQSISVTRGEPGSILTLYGNGFGYTHTSVDLSNVNRYLRSYGGVVYIGTKLCSVLEWAWEKIVFQLPMDAETGSIKVQLTAPIVQNSNLVGFEIYEGIPADDIGIELFVCDRTNPNIIVRQLDGAFNKSFQMLQNKPGSGSFSISRYDDTGGDRAYITDDNLILVKLDGNPLFKWIIESRKPNYVDSGEKQIIEVSGRGVLNILSRAVVYPENMGTPALDRPFTGTASKILRTLLHEAQNRGGLVGVTIDWQDDMDSLGNMFTEDVNLTFHVGTPLSEVVSKFTDGLGYFDIEMTPNLVLKIYKSRGMDLYDKVVYRPGQAILSHQNQSDATHLVNEVLVEGGDKLLAIATNSVSQNAYGHREGYLSASNIQSGLSEYGQAYLSRAAFPTWGIQGTVTKFYDDEGNRLKPFESYLIGDWIGWKIAPEGSDDAGFDGKVRVRGITVSENDENSALEYTLELHNMMLEHEIKLNQKVERMSQFSGSDVLAVPPSSSGTYSESEINTILATKANTNHLHTNVYSEIDHVHDFLELTDTPDSYLGQGSRVVAVKADGSGLEFVSGGGGTSLGGCLAWVTFNGITNANATGTYAQSTTTVTVTLAGHGYKVGHMIYADITSGTGVDGAYKITEVTTNTFKYTAGTSLTTSGNITLRRCTIRRGAGIHSVSDIGTGYYAVNFMNELIDANYAFCANACEPSATSANTAVAASDPTEITNLFIGLTCEDLDGGYIDCPVVSLTIFG